MFMMPAWSSRYVLQWLLVFVLADAQSSASWSEKPTFRPVFTGRPFMVVWNAPTQDCNPRFKVPLDLSLFDLQASPNEGFVRQDLTIFYHDRLGLYPYYDEHGVPTNGGVPQNASLPEHLDRLQDHIEKYIPSVDKYGLAVIDWEEWRPIWVRNWNIKDIYRNASRKLVTARHPTWASEQVNKQAQYEFENAAREFMTRTLKQAKSFRPRQLWGFYLFPDCYNHDYSKNKESYTGRCPDVEVSRNDQLSWLWEESTALYPSIYLNQSLASSENGRKFVRFRVQEAMRISNKHHKGYSLPVFVYIRPTYIRMLDLLSEEDLVSTLGESAAQGAAGVIFWGDAEYTKNKDSCQKIKTYLEEDLGRYIVNVTTAAELCSQSLCNRNGRCLRRDNYTNAFLHLNPASFRIMYTSDGSSSQQSRLRAVGEMSADDVRLLRLQFRCQCYVDWYGGSCGTQRSTQNSATKFSVSSVLMVACVALFVALL